VRSTDLLINIRANDFKTPALDPLEELNVGSFSVGWESLHSGQPGFYGHSLQDVRLQPSNGLTLMLAARGHSNENLAWQEMCRDELKRSSDRLRRWLPSVLSIRVVLPTSG